MEKTFALAVPTDRSMEPNILFALVRNTNVITPWEIPSYCNNEIFKVVYIFQGLF